MADDLISREEAKALFDDIPFYIGMTGGCVKEMLDNLPSIKVEPVRHGRWVYDHWCEFKCSECGEESNSKPYKGRENFCPNCGASMTRDLVSNKYTMELVWHSCTSYLPKEDYNPCLYVTNGREVFPVVWKRDPDWQRFVSGNWYIEPGVNSEGFWWADLVQTVKGFAPVHGG